MVYAKEEITMTTSEIIKRLCFEKNVSLAELARRMGQTPQNFGKKLKRETVSQNELKQIAEILGVRYEQEFRDTNDAKYNPDSNESIAEKSALEKYVSEELGLSIQPTHGDGEDGDDYIRLSKDAFSKLNSLFSHMPHLLAELHAESEYSEAYRVIYDRGLGHLQQSAKNRDRFRSNVVAFGTNNDITGQAELESLRIKVTSPSLLAFDVAAIVTSQYYLTRIDSKLSSLDSKLDYVQAYLEESDKSKLWANGQFLKGVSNCIYEILQDDQYRQATIATVQDIRIDSLANIKLYHNLISNYIIANFDEKGKKVEDTFIALNKFQKLTEAYCYAVYVYGFSYIVEVILSQITDQKFLENIKSDIESNINVFDLDVNEKLNDFLEKAKSLNPGKLSRFLSSKGSGFPITSSGSVVFTLFDTAITLAADLDIARKKIDKEQAENQIDSVKRNIRQNYEDLYSLTGSLSEINDLYNGHVELLIDQDAAYIKLPNNHATVSDEMDQTESEFNK